MRFRYGHADEMEQVAHETFYGYATHYIIGVGLAVPYVLVWDLLVGGPASPGWALVLAWVLRLGYTDANT